MEPWYRTVEGTLFNPNMPHVGYITDRHLVV